MSTQSFKFVLKNFESLSQNDFEKKLNEYSNSYFNGVSQISDELFDNLVDLFQNKFNIKYNQIGYTPLFRNKVKLPFMMPSLNKATDEKTLNNWLIKQSNQIVLSDKIDGISCLLFISDKFENNKIFTRGNGLEGTDISHLIPFIDFGIDVNSILKNKINKDTKLYQGYYRGELVLPKNKFDKYSKLFSNPRNAVSGVINSKEFNKNILKDIKFIAYQIISKNNLSQNPFDQFIMLEKLKFYIPFYTTLNKIDINIQNLTKLVQNRKDNAEYEIDGIVLSNIIFEDKYSSLLNTNNKNIENPKDQIAFKIKGDTAEALVEFVEWNLSKSGLYKPRVKIQPTELNGVIINYATGNNAKFIVQNNIGSGALVVLTRSGDVIPKIIDVLEPGIIDLPKDSIWNDSKVELIASKMTEEEKNEIAISRINYAISELDIKNIGPATVKKLVSYGFDNILKFIKINKNDLVKIEGFKDQSISNFLNSLDRFNHMSLVDWMIASSCFIGLGRKKLESIVKNIPNFIDLYHSNKNKLLSELSNIGMHKTGEDFVDYLDDFIPFYNLIKSSFIKNNDNNISEGDKPLEDKLVKLSKEINKKVNLKSNFNFKDKVVVFTGVRNKDLEKLIENNGGKIVSTFSGKVNLVITNDINGSSSTLNKAREKEVQIINIQDLL